MLTDEKTTLKEYTMETTNNKNNLAASEAAPGASEAALGANNDLLAIQEVPVYPAAVTADLSGDLIASMQGVNWHQTYDYDLIVQPYQSAYIKNNRSETFHAEGPRYAVLATRYLIRATKYLMGKMETTFYVMPLVEGEKLLHIRSCGQEDNEVDVAFKEYVRQHILNTDYVYGKGFMSDKGKPVIEPVSGSLVAFCFDYDHGPDDFELLLQPHQPAFAAPLASKRFVVRATHSGGFNDQATAFYEMPLDQGEQVLAGDSDLKRTAILERLATGQGIFDLPASSRWPLLLGRDDLHRNCISLSKIDELAQVAV